VLPWLTGAWALILYAPIESGIKVHLIHLAAWIFGGMFVLVAAFAWFNPRNLLYGEAGHRFERRLEFGTERRSYSSQEVQDLPPSRNPQQLKAGEEADKL